MFKMEFDLCNACFVGLTGREEVARILERVAVRISDGETSGKVLDINGNTVGLWSIAFDNEEEVT